MHDSPSSSASPPGTDLHKRLAANVWKLYVIRMFFWMHFISAVLVPFYRDWGGQSLGMILLINGWFMLWCFLLEIPTGTVADLLGRRVSLILGALVAAVAFLIYTSAPSLPRFLFAEVLSATAFTLMSGADAAMMWDTLRDLGRTGDADRSYRLLEAAQQTGIVLGALGGSVIAYYTSVRWPLAAQAVPTTIAALVAWSLVEPASHRALKRPTFGDIFGAGLRTFFGSTILKALAFDMVFSAVIAWMVIWTYQPLLEGAAVPLFWFGTVHAFMSLSQIAFLARAATIERWLGSKKRLLFLGPLVVGAGYLVLGTVRVPPIVVLAILAIAAFGLARPTLYMALLNPHIESEQRATVLSVVGMFRTLAIAIAYLPIGQLANRSVHELATVLGVCALLGAGLSWFLWSRRELDGSLAAERTG